MARNTNRGADGDTNARPGAAPRLRTMAREIRYTAFNRTIVVFALLSAALYGVAILTTDGTLPLPPPVASFASPAAVVLTIYLVASVVVRFTARLFVRILTDADDIEHRLILIKLYAFLVYLIATTVVLWRLGLSAQNLTIFLGLATTGFAFAVRDILTSYFVWFMLLTKKPFRIGDYIRIADTEGRVQHVGTFYVVVDDSPDTREDYTRVPNKLFLEKTVTNYGRDLIRTEVRLPVEPVPKDFATRYTRFTEAVHDDFPTAACSLDVAAEKVVILVQLRTVQAERSTVRDAVIQSYVRVFRASASASRRPR